MAELADALDSGSSTFTGVGVQLSLAAPAQTTSQKSTLAYPQKVLILYFHLLW
jgi:hypothetical protein